MYKPYILQTGGGGKSSQEIIEDLASDILSKLPPEFNLEEVQVKYIIMNLVTVNTEMLCQYTNGLQG